MVGNVSDVMGIGETSGAPEEEVAPTKSIWDVGALRVSLVLN